VAVGDSGLRRWRRHSLGIPLEVFLEAVWPESRATGPKTGGVWPMLSAADPERLQRPRQICEQAAQSLGLRSLGLGARWPVDPVFSAPLARRPPGDRAMAGGVRRQRDALEGAAVSLPLGVVTCQGKTWGPEVRDFLLRFVQAAATCLHRGWLRSEVLPAFYNDPERRALCREFRGVSPPLQHQHPAPLAPWPSRCGAGPHGEINTLLGNLNGPRPPKSHLDAPPGVPPPPTSKPV